MRFSWLLLVLLVAGCAIAPTGQKKTGALSTSEEAATAYQKHHFKKALTLYQTLVKKTPDAALPWFRIGNIHALQQHPDKAVAAYRRAVAKNPEYYKAWHNMGIVYLRQAGDAFTQMAVRAPAGDPMGKLGEKYATGVLKLLGEKRAPMHGKPESKPALPDSRMDSEPDDHEGG